MTLIRTEKFLSQISYLRFFPLYILEIRNPFTDFLFLYVQINGSFLFLQGRAICLCDSVSLISYGFFSKTKRSISIPFSLSAFNV